MANLPSGLRQSLHDALTHAPGIRRAASPVELVRAARARIRHGKGSVQALGSLLRAARLAYPFPPGSAMDRRLLAALATTSLSGFDYEKHFPETADRSVRNGIILKAPAPGERGVLLVTFEDQWLRLLRYGDTQALARDYELVLSPTWSPPYDLPMALVTSLWPGERIFTLLSNFADAPVYARFSRKLRPVPLLASSWVDPAVFTAGDTPKQFDVVMVANFAPYKRHRAFFAALAAAKKQGRKLRALLAGVPWEGRTDRSLRAMAAGFGVDDQIDIQVNLGDEGLRAAIRSARTAVIFSLIEGSCVAAAECLLLGVPLGLLANAHIGSKAFVNEDTGMLLRPGARKTAADLIRLVDQANRYRPREWMLQNGATYQGSTKLLEKTIRAEVLRTGGAFTSGIVEHKHVRLRPRYADLRVEERFAPLFDGFLARYGVAFHLDRGTSARLPVAVPIGATSSIGLTI
jgi:glycosyltransferase involved in cell wall biosynthesis